MTISADRAWETIELIEGHFLGFAYRIEKAQTGWKAFAFFRYEDPNKPARRVTLLAASPGEALTSMFRKIMDDAEKMRNDKKL